MTPRLVSAAVLLLASVAGTQAAPAANSGAGRDAPVCCAFPFDDIAQALGDKIWAAPAGRQEGPFEPSQVLDLIRDGRITEATLVFAGPLKTWTKAGDVPALARHIASERQAEAERQPASPPEPPPAPPPETRITTIEPPPVADPKPERASLPPGIDEARLRTVSAAERQDFGIPAPAGLHTGAPHAPTPTVVPGARLIDTLNLASLLGQQPPVPVVVLDALGSQDRLPNAITIPWASGGQTFEDAIQQRLAQGMQGVAAGNLDVPVVTYCYDPHCWMSYNVAVRLVRLGYRNVLWYRGGIASWTEAGLPTQPQAQQ